MRQAAAHNNLQQWLWKTFRQHALIPILFVESTLLMAYVATAYVTSIEINDELRRVARMELEQVAEREAKILDNQLSGVTEHLMIYAEVLTDTFDKGFEDFYDTAIQNVVRGDKGQLYSTYGTGNPDKPAFFYSGITPIEKQDLNKVRALNTTATTMRAVTAYNSMIQQIYFNSADSLNHIYPPFDVNEQYASDIEIPNFNFYFLANERYNPDRKPVWTELYLDPAGSGWMLSNIVPIYNDDVLEGVAGVDVTITGLVNQISSTDIPWDGFAVLLGPENEILALSDRGQTLMGLSLETKVNKQKVTSNITADEQFSFAQVLGADILLNSTDENNLGTAEVSLNNDNFIVSWKKLATTQWVVATAIPKDELYAGADSIKRSTHTATWYLLLALAIFYATYFVYIKHRASKVSEELLTPVRQLQSQVSRVGSSSILKVTEQSKILEFNEIQSQVFQMSVSLNKTLKQLKASQTRLQAALEGGNDALITVHKDSNSVVVSKEFNRFLGTNLNEEMTTSEYDQLIHPDDIERVQKSREYGLTYGEKIQIDYRLRHNDGSYIWVQSRGQKIDSDEFGGFALVGTISDISAQKAFELALSKAKDAAERENEAKTKLLSSVTHELRTPLTSIMGVNEILRVKLADPKLQSYTNQIEASALTLKALIDDLLVQTQLESGMLAINTRPVSAKEWLFDTIEHAKKESPENNERIILDNYENIAGIQILIDPSRAKQIIDNILSNALKYSPRGAPIHINAYAQGHQLSISIKDFGPGVPAHLKELLFNPFERLGRESGTINGTGLGLSICKELISLMGGSITYTKEKYAGSNFTITFDIYEYR